MTRTLLDEATMKAVRELAPVVKAVNALIVAYETATDHMLEEDDDGYDGTIRELAYERAEALVEQITEIAESYNLEFRFNRLTGEWLLLDRRD